MTNKWLLLAMLVLTQRTFAQADLTEPPDFPNSLPGPAAAHSGVECMLVASGSIVPGDVDWVQVTFGFASARTIVDVDFASPTGRSSVLAAIVGGTTRFGMSDGNKPDDDLCGLGALTNPLGSTTDSAVDMGATSPGTIMNIAITGFGDSGFSGNHSQNFDYELWVYVLREDVECMNDADCDDGVDCTVDRCDVVDGTCHSFPDDGACDDGLFCNGNETCEAGTGCQDGLPPCGEDVACDEANDRCAGCFTDADCDDGSFCNGAEVCVSGVCKAGAVPTCDDGVDCTVDFCSAEKDRCVHVPRHSLCNDHNFCNGRETCHPQNGCQPGHRRCRLGSAAWHAR